MSVRPTMEGTSYDVINNITARIALQFKKFEEQDEEE